MSHPTEYVGHVKVRKDLGHQIKSKIDKSVAFQVHCRPLLTDCTAFLSVVIFHIGGKEKALEKTKGNEMERNLKTSAQEVTLISPLKFKRALT